MHDTDTATGQAAQGMSAPPVIAPDELYDRIMGSIDPELTTAGLAGLREKYANETPQEKAARAERYTRAFEEYQKRLADHGIAWSTQFAIYQREALASL